MALSHEAHAEIAFLEKVNNVNSHDELQALLMDIATEGEEEVLCKAGLDLTQLSKDLELLASKQETAMAMTERVAAPKAPKRKAKASWEEHARKAQRSAERRQYQEALHQINRAMALLKEQSDSLSEFKVHMQRMRREAPPC